MSAPAQDQRERSVVEAFLQTAARDGARAAVVHGTSAVGYGELADRVLRIAAGLRARGIGHGDVVAVRLAPSADCVAALLGVMAAGAAYLPIDVAIPASRGRRYVEIAGARATVERDSSGELGNERVDVDALLATRPPAEPLDLPTADELAYVIFTSGSTGEPKGVMCVHGPVLTAVRYMIRDGFVTRDARVMYRTSIGFDPSLWEMFAPLLAGAVLVIGSDLGRNDPEALIADVAQHGATILQVVPTLLEYLAASPAFGRLDSLRFVFTGGETLTAELAARTLAASRATLVNLYGPTETTVHVTRWPCPRPLPGDVPLGRPFPGIDILVLDGERRPVAAGQIGEICIAGACVARGYINRPELTAARFVEDPAGGARMYRTGDRGHYGSDGLLRYDGRSDRQVKVRGVRVELDEVEHALRGALDGRLGAVIAARNAFGDKELVAFVDGAVDGRAVRAQLQRALPAAMLPSRLVALEGFPTLSNGKTDYVALQKKAESILDGRRD